MKDEFYQMEYESWDEGTDGLSLELEAAYLRLCHQMYRRRGSIPEQVNTLARIWRCHPNKAKRLIDQLVEAGKIERRDGHLANTKVTQVLGKRGITSRHRSDAGHKGGTRSAEIRRNHLKNKEAEEALASSQTNQRREEKSIEENNITAVPSARAAKPSEDFQKFWASYPKRDGANPKHPAEKVFAAAVKSGTAPAEIIGAADRYRSQMRSKQQEGTPYVQQAQNWLKQRRWQDYPAGEASAADNIPRETLERTYRACLLAEREGREWPSRQVKKSDIPADFIARFNTEFQERASA